MTYLPNVKTDDVYTHPLLRSALNSVQSHTTCYQQRCKRTVFFLFLLVAVALCSTAFDAMAQTLPGIPSTTSGPSSPLPGNEPRRCDTENPTNCNLGATDIGSSPASPLPNSGIGNPINLMTGNKFQNEMDFSLPGSALMFNRMYNSSQANSTIGIGYGWRHSYAVSIMDTGENSRQIIQSDGAIIYFSAYGTDESGYPRFRAAHNNHGFLIQKNNRHDWILNDGRTLSFQGSYLVQINWPDQRNLKLFYRSEKLESVTDESGRVITFSYAPSRDSGLETFKESRFGTVAGQLESITLPDGTVIEYNYDANGNLTRARFPDATSREYHYEEETYANHLTGITNRNGHRFATWSYDEYGRGASSEHADGAERVTLKYPDPLHIHNGEMVQTLVTNSLGQQSTYSWQRTSAHDTPKLLASEGAGCVTCPETGFVYTYDASGRLVQSRKTGLGNSVGSDTVMYSYDEYGRPSEIRKIDEAGIDQLIERYEYEDGFDLYPIRTYLPSVNTTAERVIETVRDDSGLLLQVTETGFTPWVTLPGEHEHLDTDSLPNKYVSSSRITKFVYDEGKLISINGPADGDGDTSLIKWDELNRVVSIQQPGRPEMVFGEFDSMGRATQVFNGSAAPFNITYSTVGLISTINYRAIDVEFVYDAEGNLLAFTDANGHTTTYDYDAVGRRTTTTDAFGRTRIASYDDESRTQAVSVYGVDGSLIKALSMTFGDDGLLQSEDEQLLNANGELINRGADFEHNALRQMTGITDSTTGDSVSVDIDSQNRKRVITHSNGYTQTDLFDALWQDAGVTDARDNTTRHIRNDFGERVGIVSQDTGIERLELNSVGLATARVREDSGTTRYTYDAAGRVLSRAHTTSGTTNYTYDERTGKIASVVNSVSEEYFEYNQYGRLSKHVRTIDSKSFETSYDYNERGRIARKVLPDGQTLSYHYHENGVNSGQLRAITRNTLLGLMQQPVVADIDLESRDGATGWMSHNGVHTRIKHAATGEIQSINTVQEQSLDYVFDDYGRITSITQNGKARRFSYNGNRLATVETDQQVIRFQYDALGNRVLSEVRSNNELIEQTYLSYAEPGQGNRLLETTNSVSGLSESYTYDTAGSPIVRGTLTTVYDSERRPVRIARDGKLLAEYAYNGFGERIKKVVYSAGRKPKVTYFLYDNNSLSATVEPDEGKITNYVYIEPHRVVAQLVGSEIYAIHSDHLGTPIRMSGEDGEVLWSASYTPFGKASIRLSERTLNLRYPGQYFDSETGTHYNYFRDYDPSLGRYLTSDPIGLTGGLNSYAYAGLQPTQLIDPLGLLSGDAQAYIRALRNAGVIAAADGPVPAGDAIAVAYLIGFIVADVVISGVVAPDLVQSDINESYNAVMAEIRLYSPGYGDAHSGNWQPTAADVTRQIGILNGLQDNYVTRGTCNANFDQNLHDKAVASRLIRGIGPDPVNADLSQGSDTHYRSLFNSDAEYQAAITAFSEYKKRGGRKSFLDWLLGEYWPSLYGTNTSNWPTDIQVEVNHQTGNRRIRVGDRVYNVPANTDIEDILANDPMGDEIQDIVRDVARQWSNDKLTQAEVDAINQARADGKDWLIPLLIGQAKGRWVERETRRILDERYPGVFSRPGSGPDLTDPRTGRKYDILSGTPGNLQTHGTRPGMTGELWRYITF